MLFFDAINHPILQKIVPKEDDQDNNESRKLWNHVSKALLKKDFNLANEEKFKLEEDQRHFAQVRSDNDLDWQPNFFRQQQDGQWVLIERNMYIAPMRKWHMLIFTILGFQNLELSSMTI